MAKRTKIDYENMEITWYLNGKLSTKEETLQAIKNKSVKIQQANKSA